MCSRICPARPTTIARLGCGAAGARRRLRRACGDAVGTSGRCPSRAMQAVAGPCRFPRQGWRCSTDRRMRDQPGTTGRARRRTGGEAAEQCLSSVLRAVPVSVRRSRDGVSTMVHLRTIGKPEDNDSSVNNELTLPLRSWVGTGSSLLAVTLVSEGRGLLASAIGHLSERNGMRL